MSVIIKKKASYKQLHKMIGSNKFFKVLGKGFVFWAIFIYITSIPDLISWNTKKSSYIKQYVYSDFGTLYYETNGKRVYIQNIYNIDNEKITVDIPDKKTIIMYVDKNNINEGIYFDLDNSIYEGLINPFSTIVPHFILLSVGLMFILMHKENKKNICTLKPAFLFALSLFILGMVPIIVQVNNVLDYFNLKKQDNTTNATVHSEIYREHTERESHKAVAYYYIDGEKYIYEEEGYQKGKIDDKIGNTFELYYDEQNPSKTIKKENPINIIILILGILLCSFAFPFVFLRNKMEEKIIKEVQ